MPETLEIWRVLLSASILGKWNQLIINFEEGKGKDNHLRFANIYPSLSKELNRFAGFIGKGQDI